MRAAVLVRQGVKINKRARLGHTGHFGKVLEVPVERVGKGVKAAGDEGKKKKGKFNKFKERGGAVAILAPGGGGGGERKEERGRDLDSAGAGNHNGGKSDRVERVPGESFCKFMKRLNTETREKLNEQAAKATKVGVFSRAERQGGSKMAWTIRMSGVRIQIVQLGFPLVSMKCSTHLELNTLARPRHARLAQSARSTLRNERSRRRTRRTRKQSSG